MPWGYIIRKNLKIEILDIRLSYPKPTKIKYSYKKEKCRIRMCNVNIPFPQKSFFPVE